MKTNSPSENSLLAKTLLNNWLITINDTEYSNFKAKNQIKISWKIKIKKIKLLKSIETIFFNEGRESKTLSNLV